MNTKEYIFIDLYLTQILHIALSDDMPGCIIHRAIPAISNFKSCVYSSIQWYVMYQGPGRSNSSCGALPFPPVLKESKPFLLWSVLEVPSTSPQGMRLLASNCGMLCHHRRVD
jgi:hypothetical protein